MMETTVGLGPRIVCFTDTGICDGPREHDIRLWTDGVVAYAECVGGISMGQQGSLSRDTHYITVTCNAVVDETRGGDPITCTGHATFDLTQEAWTTDRASVDTLNAHGERVES